MAWNAQDLAAIEAALASPTKRIFFKDRQKEYRGVDELLKVRAEMINDIASASGKPSVRQVRIYTGSGW